MKNTFRFLNLPKHWNKQAVKNYLLYAIGEILLIVIDILIAVQINNWNERSKAKANSKDYLKEMLSDLASDTLYLNRMAERLTEQLAYEEWAFRKNDFSVGDIDSIKLAFQTRPWDFYINDRTFQKIQNAAESKLIGYDSLYADIAKYYTITKKRIDENTQLEHRVASQENKVVEVLRKHVELRSASYSDYSSFEMKVKFPEMDQKEEPAPVIECVSSMECRNYIKDTYTRHSYIYLSLVQCKSEAKRLFGRIENALELGEL
jgi:hypothetical protein